MATRASIRSTCPPSSRSPSSWQSRPGRNTPVGEKKVVAYVDNIRLELFVDITSANQSADVSTKVSSKIASIGDKITYNLHIKNLQAKENDLSAGRDRPAG